MRYQATIRHHSIAYARTIDAGETLHAAKINATREFRGGYLDHEIVIIDTAKRDMGGREDIVACKAIGDHRWY